MRRDWLLVGSDIRLRAGVLSHWLRERHDSNISRQVKDTSRIVGYTARPAPGEMASDAYGTI